MGSRSSECRRTETALRHVCVASSSIQPCNGQVSGKSALLSSHRMAEPLLQPATSIQYRPPSYASYLPKTGSAISCKTFIAPPSD